MQSKAQSVDEYIRELPADRAHAITAIRNVIKKHMDAGFCEGMQYGMIGYYVPHSNYANGYHCDPKQPLPFAGLASQKGNISLYFMHLYADPKELKWFQGEYAKTGKKLNMGKSCIRFRGLEDVPLELIGKVLSRITAKKYVELYEKAIRPDTAVRTKLSAKEKSKGNTKESASLSRESKGKKVASKPNEKATKSKSPMAASKQSTATKASAAKSKGSVGIAKAKPKANLKTTKLAASTVKASKQPAKGSAAKIGTKRKATSKKR